MVLIRQDHGLVDIRPWSFIQKTVVRLREDHGPITKIRIRFESFALEGGQLSPTDTISPSCEAYGLLA